MVLESCNAGKLAIAWSDDKTVYGEGGRMGKGFYNQTKHPSGGWMQT